MKYTLIYCCLYIPINRFTNEIGLYLDWICSGAMLIWTSNTSTGDTRVLCAVYRISISGTFSMAVLAPVYFKAFIDFFCMFGTDMAFVILSNPFDPREVATNDLHWLDLHWIYPVKYVYGFVILCFILLKIISCEFMLYTFARVL